VKFLAVCLGLLASEILLANQGNVRLTTRQSGELQLQIQQATLAQALDNIADTTGVQVHYSGLPSVLVSVECIGVTVKSLLDCLLNNKADVVYRQRPALATASGQIEVDEVWVLGNSAGVAGNVKIKATGTQSKPTVAQVDGDVTDELLAQAKSADAGERAAAIAGLMLQGRPDDAKVRKVLENALSDPDANVRAQAITSLAGREGYGAAPAQLDALQDSDASVRLMTLESAGNNATVLEQALTDSNEDVRIFAEMKLKELSAAGAESGVP